MRQNGGGRNVKRRARKKQDGVKCRETFLVFFRTNKEHILREFKYSKFNMFSHFDLYKVTGALQEDYATIAVALSVSCHVKKPNTGHPIFNVAIIQNLMLTMDHMTTCM